MAEVKYLDKTGLSSVWSKVKGIVTPKADKVSGATAGHLAGLNSNGNLTDSGLPATNIAQKDGSYSGMTVGAAEDLVSAESVASEFTSRITGGSTAVGKGGTALVDKIKGRTLVLNQTCRYNTVSTSVNGVTVTVFNNRISLSGTATSNIGRTGVYLTLPLVKLITGHKYLYVNTVGVQFYVTSQSLSGSLYQGFADTSDIFTFTKSSFSDGLVAPIVSAGTECNYSGYFFIVDLTLMFGSGYEPSTVDEFEELYGLSYIHYEPGKPINNGLSTEYDLVWNQLIANGNFANGSDGWAPYNSTISASKGELTIVKSSGSASTGGFARTNITGDPTHKYYMACDAEMLTSGVELYLGFHTTGGTVGGNAMASTVSSSYIRISQVASPILETDTLSARVGAAASPASSTGKIKNVILVDLTLMFGAGNEPASPEEFEAMFPADYYAYDTGTEQHFSFPQFKTKIETEGWNLVDIDSIFSGISGWQNLGGGEWYVPSAKENSGTKVWENNIGYTGQVHIHFEKKAITGLNGERLQFHYTDGSYEPCNPSTALNTYQTGDFLSNGSKIVDYIMLTFGSGSHDCYLKNICISLSDPSRNGTYEPYWRSELELGLGDIKVKSPNLWDEEWENGMINTDTGQDAPAAYVRCKNYIACKPSTTYTFDKSSTSNNIRIFQYDSAKNYINNSAFSIKSGTLTTDPNCAYLRFYLWTDTTYSPSTNGVSICEAGHGYEGRYFPYGDGGVITITGGLKSAGPVYDEISGGKFINRLDVEDMGKMVWSTTTQDRIYSASLASVIKKTGGDTEYANSVCPRYLVGTAAGAYAHAFDKLISVNAAGNVIVYDSAFAGMSASDVTLALAGVPLYYELAQPIEYELAEAIPTAMRNDPYGTERRLPEDTAAIVTAPFRADITYSTNIKEAVQSLPQNYININSMQDFLAALGAQMGGTWTMRQADGKFDFTFTPNPSNE